MAPRARSTTSDDSYTIEVHSLRNVNPKERQHLERLRSIASHRRANKPTPIRTPVHGKSNPKTNKEKAIANIKHAGVIDFGVINSNRGLIFSSSKMSSDLKYVRKEIFVKSIWRPLLNDLKSILCMNGGRSAKKSAKRGFKKGKR